MLDAGAKRKSAYGGLDAHRRKSGVDVPTTIPSVWIGGSWVELLYLSGVVL